MFTIPTIVTSDDLTKRSYITFYFNNERVREYHGMNIGVKISPNRAKTLIERNKQLEILRFEYHKALDNNSYPIVKGDNANKLIVKSNKSNNQSVGNDSEALRALFEAVRAKLNAGLSKKYKRNLKSIYRQFRDFMTTEEKCGELASLKVNRIDTFLLQFGSSGTYYMNKRRDLGVLFSAAGRYLSHPIETIKVTSKRKAKAVLHRKYEKEQLQPILNYLKSRQPKLHLCCLLTYGSWLRPHEEIRLLNKRNFTSDLTEIHLSGDENKGGRVRIVYVPEYTRDILLPIISKLDIGDNIFTGTPKALNEYYFNTQWSRAWKKLHSLGLIHQNQTIYSFRHTAAVDLYRRTKDVYLLQKLLGHSTIVVTLKYLRTLGEINTEDLINSAPQL